MHCLLLLILGALSESVVVLQVMGAQQYLVRPSVADVNENVSVLSEQLTSESVLTEELVKSAGQPLEAVLRQFERWVRGTLLLDPAAPSFRLVTDGQLPLRQCLHPEACNKDLQLPSYYQHFHDLRKELARFLQPRQPCLHAVHSVRDMLACILYHDRSYR